MQKTGRFQLGDVFDIGEFSKFPCMDIFRDQLKENSTLLVTTATHLLTFKEVPGMKEKNRIYQLKRVC